ncbi:MAG: hypothetical protein ACYCYM_01385 [Saccharofermentanales bacterium]
MATNRWKQDHFILSTFSGGDDFRSLSILKDAGFNLVEFTFKSREAVTKALEACEVLELESLVQDRSFCGIGDSGVAATDEIVQEAIDYYSRFRHIMGYYIWDEPFLDCFQKCRNTTDIFRRLAPDKLAFSVVFPSYGVYTWAEGTYSWEKNEYAEYINEYLKIVDPDVFSMDYYVFQMNADIHELNYYDLWRDLGYCRKMALETDKPLWFYYQGLGLFNPADKNFIADMTPEKIRVQMSASLAYGVKQLSCFCAAGLIFDQNNEKTFMFEHVKEINQEILSLGEYLLDKASYKLYHTGIKNEYLPGYFLDDLAEDDLISEVGDHLIIGRMKDETQQNYLVVVNKEFEKRTTGRLVLKDRYTVMQYVPERRDTITLSQDTTAIEYDLAEGACSIYKLVKESMNE